MLQLNSRLYREKRTIKAMVKIYCQANHCTKDQLCYECAEVFNYASYRITKCPHQEAKPSCAKCAIHCFNTSMKEKVKKIMRFAGPKMLLKHPLLSFMHYLDSLKSGVLKRS
ncbi:MAG: nitrous oxide-stimulated promoter family protein [Acidobacteriota bacterium]